MLQNLKIQARGGPEDQGEVVFHLIEIMELGVAVIKGGLDRGEIVTTLHNLVKSVATQMAFLIIQATAQ